MNSQVSGQKVPAQPFIKWVGGKRHLAGNILNIACIDLKKGNIKSYSEPFVGGGAMFYHLKAEGFLSRLRSGDISLSDINEPLVATYLAIKQDVDKVVALLESHRSMHYKDLKNASCLDLGRSDRGGGKTERGSRSALYSHYHKVRLKYNKLKKEFSVGNADKLTVAGFELAAMFLYLNRAGFNGMYRENSKGEMNIPPGRYIKPELVNADVLRSCAAALKGVELQVRGFEEALSEAKEGTLVYLDPPYFETFTGYSQGGFDYQSQERLAKLAGEAAERGASVIISNSETKEMRKLYEDNGFKVGKLLAARNINSDGTGRTKVTEIVAFRTNYSH